MILLVNSLLFFMFLSDIIIEHNYIVNIHLFFKNIYYFYHFFLFIINEIFILFILINFNFDLYNWQNMK